MRLNFTFSRIIIKDKSQRDSLAVRTTPSNKADKGGCGVVPNTGLSLPKSK